MSLGAPESTSPREPGVPGGSLRQQALTVFGVTMLILLAVSIAGVYFLVHQTEQEGWRGRQREATQRVAQTVGDFMTRQQNLLQVLNLLGRDQPQGFPEALERLPQIQPVLLELVHIDATGRIKAHAPADGGILANLFTVSQSNWFRTAQQGKKYVGDMQLSAADEPYLIFSVPAADGEVLASRLRMDILNEVVADLHFGSTGIAYLVNRNGRVVAHTSPQRVLSHIDDQHPDLLRLIRTNTALWSGEYRNFQGEPVVGTMLSVPGTPWVAVTELSRAEAYASTRRALWSIAVVTALISVVMVAVIITLLERRFLRPMGWLQKGVQQVSRGDLSYRLDIVGPYEINQVATAFNDMSSRLQEREQAIALQTEALRDSEARYRAIVEDQTELVCRSLPDGSLTFVNEAYCRCFGKGREELIGSRFSPRVLSDDQPLLAATRAVLGPGNPVASIEHRIVLPDGAIRWQHWTHRAIFDVRGRICEFASVGRDVTERREVEEALHQAKEAAESANRAKSQFLANMSHEIRTPMNAIIGMTHLAMQAQAEDKRRRFLQTVKHSAESLLSLLNDILDFSKMEAGQLQLNSSPFDLRQLLEGIVSTMNVPAIENGLKLQISTEPDLPAVFIGDELRLRQILLNLVGNAIKFTPAGSVTIDVALENPSEADQKATLHFTVVDTGIGIPPEKLARIFNNFEQGDNSYVRKYAGTGLGLSICKQLTELMDGGIWVESRMNAGSSFHFTVRLQPSTEKPSAPASTGTAGQEPLFQGLRLLIVDDNEVNRDVASMILEQDHAVSTAGNGLEALMLLASRPFDAILMDVQMPVMDGLSATTFIRAFERGETAIREVPGALGPALAERLAKGHIPIIAMTAHAMGEDYAKCLDAGMDAYITKPFQPESLTATLRSLCVAGSPSGVTGAVRPAGDEPLADCPLPATVEDVVLYFKKTTRLGDERIANLLALCRRSLVDNLEKADEALEMKNFTGLGVAAHTLKGTLAQCGLAGWAEKAQEVYDGTKKDRDLPYADLLTDLRHGIGALLEHHRLF